MTLSDYYYKGPVITLNNGRNISLKHINQGLAYAHILEGMPFMRPYGSLVNLHLRWAEELYKNRKIMVLEPRLRPIPLSKEDLFKLRSRSTHTEETTPSLYKEELEKLCKANDVNTLYDRFEPVSLGSVYCWGLFESEPVDNEAGMLSELLLMWYQDGFAMPIDPNVIEQIKAVDWEHEAVDVDL